jgi:hypothetical protein
MALTKFELQKLYFQAGWNWVSWIDDFDCKLKTQNLPVLEGEDRFAKFLGNYSLLRYHDATAKETIRKWLSGNGKLANATEFPDGRGIDKLADDLKKHTHKKRRELSLISKLAAFAKPASFIAYDKYARKGTRIILGKTASGKYDTYVEYLADANLILNGDVGIELKKYASTLPLPTKNTKAFIMRLLDFYLMGVGKQTK